MRTEEGQGTVVVAIASNNYLLRLGLQKVVEEETWIRLIEQNAYGANLDDVLEHELPNVMIVDSEIESALPDIIRTIKEAVPAIKIILLAGMDESESIRQAFACGVEGLVLKIQPSPVLIATIDYLAHTGSPVTLPIECSTSRMNRGLTSSLTALPLQSPAPTKWPEGLTER